MFNAPLADRANTLLEMLSKALEIAVRPDVSPLILTVLFLFTLLSISFRSFLALLTCDRSAFTLKVLPLRLLRSELTLVILLVSASTLTLTVLFLRASKSFCTLSTLLPLLSTSTLTRLFLSLSTVLNKAVTSLIFVTALTFIVVVPLEYLSNLLRRSVRLLST